MYLYFYKANELVKGNERFCLEVSIAVPKSILCILEMIDSTGQVSEKLKEQTLELLDFAAQRLGKEDKEMAVTFVTNERSHELNLEYRDTDRPTDVISLEYKPELDISFDEEELAENPELAEMMGEFDSYIGELFISVDKAHEQAEDYGHSFEREMGFLAVHGFLHINGYDHYTPEEEAEMFGLQEEILTAYGLTRQSHKKVEK